MTPPPTAYFNPGAARPPLVVPDSGSSDSSASARLDEVVRCVKNSKDSINLLPSLDQYCWPVKNQGQTPTCVAFATTACLELSWWRLKPSSPPPELSPFFLYCMVRKKEFKANEYKAPGWDGGGIHFSNARDALIQYGICALNKYNVIDCSSADESAQNAATKIKSIENPESFRICDAKGLARVQKIRSELIAGRPVAAGFYSFSTANSSTNWNDASDGLVSFDNICCSDSGNEPVYCGGHAVCIVGFEYAENVEMDGYFVFRNSYGPEFPTHSLKLKGKLPQGWVNGACWPPGYGRIAASDVARFCWEAMYMPETLPGPPT